MRRAGALLVLLAAAVVGCGKYGPPVRPHVAKAAAGAPAPSAAPTPADEACEEEEKAHEEPTPP
jgi:hypothetical protein